MSEIKTRPASIDELEHANWTRRASSHTREAGRQVDILYTGLGEILSEGLGVAAIDFGYEEYGKIQSIQSALRKRALDDGTRLQFCETRTRNVYLVRRLQSRVIGEQEYDRDV